MLIGFYIFIRILRFYVMTETTQQNERTKPDDILYGVNQVPPIAKLLLLSVQYVLIMSVYLVIVVIIAKLAHAPVSTQSRMVRLALLALAFSTTLQALGKFKLGSGFLAAPVVSAIYLEPSILAVQHGGLAELAGMTIFAGIAEIIFSRLLPFTRALFPPAVCGFIIMIVGLQLGLTGIDKVLLLSLHEGTNSSMYIILVPAVITLTIMIGLSIWCSGLARLACAFLGIAIGALITAIIGFMPVENYHIFQQAHFIAWPPLPVFDYHFSFSLVVTFIIAGIAAAIRTVGVVTTCEKINNANWKRPNIKNIEAGVLADGIGTVFAGILGVPGTSTAPSLVGITKITGVTSRVMAFVVAIILVILMFLPKFVAFFLIMPIPVAGAALVFTGSFMISGGIQIMASRNIDTRSIYLIGISLLIGLSYKIVPQFYHHLPTSLETVANSMLSLSIFIAVCLTIIFRIGIRKKSVLAVNDRYLPHEELDGFFLKFAEKCDIPSDTIDRASQTTEELIKLIQTNLSLPTINIELAYNQTDLIVEIVYTGNSVELPLLGKRVSTYLEEEGFSYGLADYWNNIFPDHMEQRTENKRNVAKLKFSN